MSHTSPSTYLTWAVLSCLLGAFLLFHLWKFDRFKCLKWNNGPYSGAFKRIMTYTYLLSVPLLIAYSVGFCIIKYKQGYINVPGEGIIPTPWELWPSAYQRAIFPLNLLFSIAWGLEMVTHLEELCFWLFLVNAGSVQQDWFRSLYFKTWTLGSLFAIIYMPVVTIVTRSDPLKSEAFTFLAGSLGSLSLTIWFTPVLFMFPSFLMGLKREGVDLNTIVRLTTFHELNCLRVLFRFFFVAPLLILGVDGVRTHKHINTSNFWTEFLTFVAAVGCIISSGITLVVRKRVTSTPNPLTDFLRYSFPARGKVKRKHAMRRVRSHTNCAPSAPRNIPNTRPTSAPCLLASRREVYHYAHRLTSTRASPLCVRNPQASSQARSIQKTLLRPRLTRRHFRPTGDWTRARQSSAAWSFLD
ncbi:hypothetical protein AcV7_001890 [Taiwanofungus camphoratus]|nr:hypothetical protein AcV7_001890 [Antrodia cinnamomea]